MHSLEAVMDLIPSLVLSFQVNLATRCALRLQNGRYSVKVHCIRMSFWLPNVFALLRFLGSMVRDTPYSKDIRLLPLEMAIS